MLPAHKSEFIWIIARLAPIYPTCRFFCTPTDEELTKLADEALRWRK